MRQSFVVLINYNISIGKYKKKLSEGDLLLKKRLGFFPRTIEVGQTIKHQTHSVLAVQNITHNS